MMRSVLPSWARAREVVAGDDAGLSALDKPDFLGRDAEQPVESAPGLSGDDGLVILRCDELIKLGAGELSHFLVIFLSVRPLAGGSE
jgi:hypothetical protein